LLQIIGVNIVLSGDNAVVVAMAVRRLAPQHQRLALVFGAGGSMALQILATLIVSQLFRLPLLLCAGGVALSWIALRLLQDETQDENGTPPPESLGHAVWTIITANCVMSLDNVLAIASIGHGRPVLIVVGLGISIVLTLTSSVLIADWMNRYPFLVTLGGGVLAWTSGRMIATDTVVSHAIISRLGVDLKDGPLWFALSVVMTVLVLFAARKGKQGTSVPEHTETENRTAPRRQLALDHARLRRRPSWTMAPLRLKYSTADHFWRLSLDALQKQLHCNLNGLNSEEAAARLVQYGPNVLHTRRKRALLIEYLSRFRNPLVLVLLTASGISAFTGEVTSFLIISLIVLMSVTLDFVQEHRAGQAAERLQQSVAVRISVLRDGAPKDLPVSAVAPGDVVLLSAGDLIPADARVVEARDFFVKQALLTGEPYPVEKHPSEGSDQEDDIGDSTNAVFMGTSVISGTAKVLVCRTGERTALGEIAETLSGKAPPTAFEQGTYDFGLLIMRLTLLLVLFVLLINAYFHRPWLESFLFAVALAVGLTPEMLPMVVSVTLARGALRMAEKKVIVKRLAAIHDLGSMDVLCTDKTGTLTEARIRLEQHLDALGRDSRRVLYLAYLNSYFETGLKSPLDDAILEHVDEVDVSDWQKIDEVPFDFERRRVSVLVDDGDSRLLVVKGALEDIVRLSTHYEGDNPDDLHPIEEECAQGITAQFEALGREGFRVLGIAWRQVERTHNHAIVDDETELVFAGFAAFLDPPKESAAPVLKALAESGVTVKVVTGDNELVTQHVCTQLGLPVTGVLTGAELAQMDESALLARAEMVNLFCRVTPAQKNRVLLALKQRGHVVGYLGDGINDAPPLHSADVGLSVDSAVDVAKEAASLILLEHDLGALHAGVLEGRRTFGNIMKYIMMGTSSNFGNMFSMAGASLLLPFLPMLPLQILLNNFLYDLSEVPIPLDTVDDEDLRTPRHWDMGFIRNFMVVIGPVSSLFDFLTFYILLAVLRADEALFHTGWFIESLATQVLVIFLIRTRQNPFQSRPSRLLALTSLAVVLVAILLPFTSVGVHLGFVPPPPLFFLMLAAMIATYLCMVEGVKRWFYRHVAPNALAAPLPILSSRQQPSARPTNAT
jgi:Mg2+-importing ATPase